MSVSVCTLDTYVGAGRSFVGCLLSAICGALLALIGCAPGSPPWNFCVYLPNHYRLIANNAEDVAILEPIYTEGPQIGPHIVALSVHGNLIYGRSVKSYRDDSEEGYFILDTGTNEAHHGLSEEQWHHELKSRWGVRDFSLKGPGAVYRERLSTTAQLAQEAANICARQLGVNLVQWVDTPWGKQKVEATVEPGRK